MVERVVVDTDVMSFVIKKDSRATVYEPELDGKQIVISFMTVAELKRWAIKKNWGAGRLAQLDLQFRNVVIYPVDLHLCQKWAEVMMLAETKGRPMSTQDAWIAATALQENLPLITNNARDLESLSGLAIISRP